MARASASALLCAAVVAALGAAIGVATGAAGWAAATTGALGAAGVGGLQRPGLPGATTECISFCRPWGPPKHLEQDPWPVRRAERGGPPGIPGVAGPAGAPCAGGKGGNRASITFLGSALQRGTPASPGK